MKIVESTLDRDMYFPQTTAKDMVVLHFTAGARADSAIATFRNAPKAFGYPVSTHYVVDIDGTVSRLFSEDFWSYHLGITGAAAENHRHDKRSVAIEIANVGPLRQKGEMLNYWPPAVSPSGLASFKTPFCQVSEPTKYVKLPTPWRGESYFAAFPRLQVDAVAELVDDICTRLRIEKLVPSPDVRFQFNIPYFSKFQGVTSHVNWRPDKTDLAPVQSDPIWSELVEKGFVVL